MRGVYTCVRLSSTIGTIDTNNNSSTTDTGTGSFEHDKNISIVGLMGFGKASHHTARLCQIRLANLIH